MLRSFQARLAAVFIGLTAAALLIIFIAVSITTRANVVDTARQELAVGKRVVDQLLADRSQQLLDSAIVLADDFGFRETVATGDLPTVRSALTNHSLRIGADAAFILDLSGEITAHVGAEPMSAQTFPYAALLARARAQGSAVSIAPVGANIYQLVIVPVRAPLQIAWVVLAFALDEEFIRALSALTGLDISIVSPALPEFVAVSTLPDAVLHEIAPLANSLEPLTGPVAELSLNGEPYLTMALELDGDSTVFALLQIALTAVLQPYRELQLQLLAIAGFALFATLIGAIASASGISQPVRELVNQAGRIAQGDYSLTLPRPRIDELGRLADAFNKMQQGIAQREQTILYQAQHDTLTDLPNRVMANDRLTQAIARSQRSGATVAVLMLDMDRFKEINDTLGHPVGDVALKLIAQRLKECVRGSDTVARLGGDEFLVMLDNADESGALKKAEEIAAYLARPMEIQDSILQVSFSIGVALCPAHGNDVETLLRRADVAMYDAKQSRDRVVLYQPGHDERHLHRLRLVADMRTALQNDEFVLEFQPKLDLANNEIRHVEALLRWQHPHHGRLMPDQFIPLAEQSGNIAPITHWVLNESLRCLRAWRDHGFDIAVSINISALDLMDTTLPDRITALLTEHGVEPAWLVIEITESAVMRDAEFAVQMLNRLKRSGVELSIDDFGTGYSSLAQLKRLPVDNLKIDKSFIIGLRENSEDAMIVKSTIELGHNMGLRVIAEGVELEETRRMLKAYRCDIAQGYLISRPMTREVFGSWYSEYVRKGVTS